MYVSATEHDRLLVFLAAELARRTLSQGEKLSAPEAIAIICDGMHAAARSGSTYDEVVATGMSALSSDDVLEGVPALVEEVRLLGTPGTLTINEGRRRITLEVTSHSQMPIRVASHFPFWLSNRRLSFDRGAARGYHLDLAAGASLRWQPGQTRRVALVAYARQASVG